MPYWILGTVNTVTVIVFIIVTGLLVFMKMSPFHFTQYQIYIWGACKYSLSGILKSSWSHKKSYIVCSSWINRNLGYVSHNIKYSVDFPLSLLGGLLSFPQYWQYSTWKGCPTCRKKIKTESNGITEQKPCPHLYNPLAIQCRIFGGCRGLCLQAVSTWPLWPISVLSGHMPLNWHDRSVMGTVMPMEWHVLTKPQIEGEIFVDTHRHI